MGTHGTQDGNVHVPDGSTRLVLGFPRNPFGTKLESPCKTHYFTVVTAGSTDRYFLPWAFLEIPSGQNIKVLVCHTISRP